LIGLVLAAAVAYCNATSSARLAALYPESGGTYVYGRRRLGDVWGYLAGAAFVVGKLASCAAMALTFAHYAAPSIARPLAVGLPVALFALVAVAALLAAPPSLLGSTQAPLRAVVLSGSLEGFAPVVQVGAAVASLGVLLSLLAGVSRTVFAMAANRHLP